MGTSASKTNDGSSDREEVIEQVESDIHEEAEIAIEPEVTSITDDKERIHEGASTIGICEVEDEDVSTERDSPKSHHDDSSVVEVNFNECGSEYSGSGQRNRSENYTAFEIPFYDTVTANQNVVTPLYSPPPIYSQESYVHVDHSQPDRPFLQTRRDEGTQTPENCSLASTSAIGHSRQAGFRVKVNRPPARKTLCQKYPEIYGKVLTNLLPIINYESPPPRPTTYLVGGRISPCSRTALSTSDRNYNAPIKSSWKTERLGGGTWVHYPDTDAPPHRQQVGRQNRAVEKPYARRLKPLEKVRFPIINPAAGDQDSPKSQANSSTTPPIILPPLSNNNCRTTECILPRRKKGPAFRDRGNGMPSTCTPLASLYSRSRPLPPNHLAGRQWREDDSRIDRLRLGEMKRGECASRERDDIVFRQSPSNASAADFSRYLSRDDRIQRKQTF